MYIIILKVGNPNIHRSSGIYTNNDVYIICFY